MKNDIKYKKKAIVLVISILIILILLLVLSYAFFKIQLSGTEGIVKVGELELVLNETSEGIRLDNAIGLSDSEGLSLDSSTFKLINNGDKAVDYIIYLDDNMIGDTDTRIDDKYLKYNLNKNGENTGPTLLTSVGSNKNRVLDSGTIEGKGTNEYSLNLWVTSDVDGNYSGQVFSGKLRVEVSQERPTVAEVLLADTTNNINTTDQDQIFITGEEPNNYIWYSGKLWRAVAVDKSDNSVKLVTQWSISSIPYSNKSSAFEESHMKMWLNDKTADGFLGNLRSPEKFIKMDSKWNASQMSDNSKPPGENEGGTLVEAPVGLLNIYEYVMSCSGTTFSKGYLNNGLTWYTLTPPNINEASFVSAFGSQSSNHFAYAYGIRPSINLKSNIKIVNGSGTEEEPYRLMGDYDIDLSGTKLNTRYSGEYIRFGNDENNLYRIVSHETEGLTKITSAEPLKEDGNFKKIQFGNDLNYSNKNIIGSFLNNEYLTNKYLTTENLNMIKENTTWYLGTVGIGGSYKFGKYKDINMSALSTRITSTKVGLLRLGELMAGQFDRDARKGGTSTTGLTTTYWTLTPYTTNKIRTITNQSFGGDLMCSNELSGIKPSLNLKTNVVIISGDGTIQNPFNIALAKD